jgi:hypothetical protein
LRYWSSIWEADRTNTQWRTPLIVAPSAPGDGKTHFEWILASRKNPKTEEDPELVAAIELFKEGKFGNAEVAKCLEEVKNKLIDSDANRRLDFVKRFQSAIGLTVTFSNDTPPVKEDISSSMVTVRMLYSHFCRNKDFLSFLVHLKSCGFGDISGQEAFDLIRSTLKESIRMRTAQLFWLLIRFGCQRRTRMFCRLLHCS